MQPQRLSELTAKLKAAQPARAGIYIERAMYGSRRCID